MKNNVCNFYSEIGKYIQTYPDDWYVTIQHSLIFKHKDYKDCIRTLPNFYGKGNPKVLNKGLKGDY